MTIEEIRKLSLEYATGNVGQPRNSRYRNERRNQTKTHRGVTRVVYSKYIKSERWKKFRSRILRERPRCQQCGGMQDLEVHHLTYERLGHELPQDVKVLCEFHHSLVDEKHMRKSGYAFLAEKWEAALG